MECVKVSRSDTTHRTFFEKSLNDHIKTSFVSASYSHHQKSIICDAPSSGDSPRRLISFVGGLDLTNGRWDTPNHELFATITKEHDGDFYQNNAAGVKENHGPRQPWHDIHMKLEGPIASDVLQNFIERWKKQGLQSAESPEFPSDEIIMNLIKTF